MTLEVEIGRKKKNKRKKGVAAFYLQPLDYSWYAHLDSNQGPSDS